MTFNYIFKSSFLEKTSSFSIIDTLIAFALGLFIFYVYKKTFNGVIYSANFGVSLMAMTLITTLVILAVTSNVILSLGMVGALSIVRFRTAIKEPLDIAFLFWSIAAGIVLGAGLIPLAVIGSIFIGVLMVVFVNRKSKDTPYILVVDCNNEAETIAVKPKIRPAERSVPCNTISPATPSARIPLVEAWLKIFVKFLNDRNDGSFTIKNIIIINKTIYKA